MVGTTKRTFEDMRTMFEGAKQSTPEGIALNRQIAENNAAVHSHAQGLIDNNGGVPAQGEAMEASANALAKSADAAKAKVTDA